MEAKAVSRVEKYFSRRLRARPLRTSPILPFVLCHPFRGGGTFSTDACAFPDFISLGKIIVALARAPSGTAMCARVSTRLRDPYVSAGVHECACVHAYACVCVNDARTMALNWRLTGEQ